MGREEARKKYTRKSNKIIATKLLIQTTNAQTNPTDRRKKCKCVTLHGIVPQLTSPKCSNYRRNSTPDLIVKCVPVNMCDSIKVF